MSWKARYLRRVCLNSSVPVPALATAARAGDDFGTDAPGLAVVVGDPGVHGGESALGRFVALGRVDDEAALLQEVGNGPVGHLDGTLGVVHEDALALAHALLVTPPILRGEGRNPTLDPPAPPPKLGLGLLLGAPLLGRPLVLGAELPTRPPPPLLVPARPAPARDEEDDEEHDQDQHRENDQQLRRSDSHGFRPPLRLRIYVTRCATVVS